LRDLVIDFEAGGLCARGFALPARRQALLDAQGRRLENFTRVETFGDNAGNGTNDVHWLRVQVRPETREVFSYQPMIVPANRVAVPAP
jgi:hypothetical protein